MSHERNQTLNIPRLMIAAPASGTGKTTVMAGLVCALRDLGLKVATFKAGPDYLDPTYHHKASGQSCVNLDLWLMGKDGVVSAFAQGCRGADIALIEGVMGLFDGLTPTNDHGSSWELAQVLACPIILVVDCSGMARSVAALVYGFAAFSSLTAPDGGDAKDAAEIVGVIGNRVGSASHSNLLGKALQSLPNQVYLGALCKARSSIFAERHLGLVSMRLQDHGAAALAAAQDLVKEGVDIGRLVALAKGAPPMLSVGKQPMVPTVPAKCRIGVARDAAFDFYYDDNLELLRSFGAELVEFSPLRDQALPRVNGGGFAFDGLYFGGGYPELYAAELAANESMRRDIFAFGHSGRMVYGECGGLMFLCQTLQVAADPSAQVFPMVGLLPGRIVMQDRLVALGYVEVETQAQSPLGPAGLRFRGHQFRYSERFSASECVGDGDGDGDGGARGGADGGPRCDEIGGDQKLVYKVRRRRDQKVLDEGYLFRQVLGSYIHAHWGSNPQIAKELVASCLRHRSAEVS